MQGGDSDDEPTLGELVEVAKRERVAAMHEREDAVMREHSSFNPYRTEWAPQSVKKRGKKSRPREISSKKPVPVGRDRCLGLSDAGVKGRSVRNFDPRFEDHCGDLREEHVERNYAFVSGLREKRKQDLEKEVRKGAPDAEVLGELNRMEQEDARRNAAKRRKEILRNLRKEEKEAVKRGKKPYFLKEKDIRKLEMKAKFEDLKKSGGVKKYIEKRRRRLASKDRKLLPQRRDVE